MARAGRPTASIELSDIERETLQRWVRRHSSAQAVVDEPVERIVAEADYFLLDNGNGELAVTVAADWRGWLGPYLLDALIEAAAARGVANLRQSDLVSRQQLQHFAACRRQGRRARMNRSGDQRPKSRTLASAAISRSEPSHRRRPGH